MPKKHQFISTVSNNFFVSFLGKIRNHRGDYLSSSRELDEVLFLRQGGRLRAPNRSLVAVLLLGSALRLQEGLRQGHRHRRKGH